MRPKGVKIDVTATQASETMGRISGVLIKNQGSTDCQVEFDADITANTYLLEAGETIWVGYPFVTLRHKTATGTTTIYLLKIIQ